MGHKPKSSANNDEFNSTQLQTTSPSDISNEQRALINLVTTIGDDVFIDCIKIRQRMLSDCPHISQNQLGFSLIDLHIFGVLSLEVRVLIWERACCLHPQIICIFIDRNRKAVLFFGSLSVPSRPPILRARREELKGRNSLLCQIARTTPFFLQTSNATPITYGSTPSSRENSYILTSAERIASQED